MLQINLMEVLYTTLHLKAQIACHFSSNEQHMCRSSAVLQGPLTILLASLAKAGRWHEHHAIRGGATAITDWDRNRSRVGNRNIWPHLVGL